MALSGDSAKTMYLAGDLERRFPEDTIVQSRYLPMIHAASILGRSSTSKEYGKAIDILAKTTPYEMGSESMVRVGFLTCYSVYLRGQAYLAARQGPLALWSFRRFSIIPNLLLPIP